jgi:hypothetical protein
MSFISKIFDARLIKTLSLNKLEMRLKDDGVVVVVIEAGGGGGA